MNYFQVTIDGKIYDRVPQTLNDVTMRRFLAFRKVPIKHELPLIYWLLNKEPQFTDSDRTEKELEGLFNLTDRMVEDIYEFMQSKEKVSKKPDTIEILGRTVDLKKSNFFTSLPYWPYVVTKKILADERKKPEFDPTDRYPEIIAHYLYKEATGKTYFEKEAEEFAEVILDLPFTQCIQLGNFFLKKQQRSKK